nr:MAG: VP3 protein [Drosophila Midmar tombus-like virus]
MSLEEYEEPGTDYPPWSSQEWLAIESEAGPDHPGSPSRDPHTIRTRPDFRHDSGSITDRNAHSRRDQGAHTTIGEGTECKSPNQVGRRLDGGKSSEGGDYNILCHDRVDGCADSKATAVGSVRIRTRVLSARAERVRSSIPVPDGCCCTTDTIRTGTNGLDRHCGRCVLNWIHRVRDARRRSGTCRRGSCAQKLSSEDEARDLYDIWLSRECPQLAPDREHLLIGPRPGFWRRVGLRWRDFLSSLSAPGIALTFLTILIMAGCYVQPCNTALVRARDTGCASRDDRCFGWIVRERDPIEWSLEYYRGAWPIKGGTRSCLHLLETNALVAASCAIPEFCGEIAVTRVQHEWWGNEHFLCSGTGISPAQHVAFQSGIPPRGGWALFRPSVRRFGGGVLIRARTPDGTFIGHSSLLANKAFYDKWGNATIPWPRVAVRHDRLVPIGVLGEPEWVERENVWVGKLEKNFNKELHVPPLDCTKNADADIQTDTGWFGQRYGCDEDGIVPTFGLHTDGDGYVMGPMHHRYSQEYGMSWIKWIEPAFSTLIRVVLGVTWSLVEEAWHLLCELNHDVRIFECALIFGLAAWHCSTWRRVAIITLAYPCCVGWVRY